MTPILRDALAHFGVTRLFAVDTEYQQADGDLPKPACVAYRCLLTGVSGKIWLWDRPPPPCPFRMTADESFVGYNFAAEAGVFFALGWPRPINVLDLWLEYIELRNTWPLLADLGKKKGKGLLEALRYFGLETRETAIKEHYQARAQQGGVYAPEEPEAMMRYCLDDADDLERLLDPLAERAKLSNLDNLSYAFLRGRFAVAIASMMRTGIPIDYPLLLKAREHRVRIQNRLIERFDAKTKVYECADLEIGKQIGVPVSAVVPQIHFRRDRMTALIEESGLAAMWPRTDGGRMYRLDKKTLRRMSGLHEDFELLPKLREFLGKISPFDFAIGADCRARCSLFPLSTKTGRNAPRGFIFAADKGLRGFIKPGPGQAVAYLDWERQEIAVAGYLSGDEALLRLAKVQDPYLHLGVTFGLMPPWATKDTHPELRQRMKGIVLGLLYGMAPKTVAHSLELPEAWGFGIWQRHRTEYWRYWQWANGQADCAAARLPLRTPFGHALHFDTDIGVGAEIAVDFNAGTARNFGVQGTSAEIMRVAAILSTEDNIAVCAPVHDAFLIEAPIAEIEATIVRMKAHMARAVEIVLGEGRSIAVDHKVACYPDSCRWEKSELFDVILAEIAAAEDGELETVSARSASRIRLVQRA
jgi:hypothetical protein